MRYLVSELKFFLLNYVVNRIPFSDFRKFCYKKAGMKIGNGSVILMGVFVHEPQNIVIGDNCCINEYCLLDGRGGLLIGNNVSVSGYSKILTGTHDCHSDSFKYKSEKVVICDYVWLGINCIVLPGVVFPKGSVLAAGSVAIKKELYQPNCMYSGIPAKFIAERKSNLSYTLSWQPKFR